MVLAPLQFSGRSLVPDVLGGIQQGQQVSQGRNILEQQRLGIQGTQQEQALRQQQAEQAAVLQQQAQDLLARSQAGEKGVATGTEIGQILLKDNKLGKNLRDVIGLNTEAKKLRAAKFGRALEQAVGDIPAQNRIIQQNIVDVEAGGGDASHSKELLTLPEDRRLKAARLFQLNALNRDELAALTTSAIEQQRKPIDRTLVEKNLIAAGFIKGTPQFQNALKQILKIDPQAQRKAATEKQLKADLKASDTVFDRAKKLRAEITTASTEFNKINSAFGRIEASSTDPSAAGDLALIFNFMKMLDPGSVVRESEFATAANAAGVPDRIRNLFNKVLTGERLGLEQRKDFLNQAKKIFDRSQKDNVTAVNKIIDIGEQFGVSKSQLIGREQQPSRRIEDLTPEDLANLSDSELQALATGGQ
jgi:hypothetical protein